MEKSFELRETDEEAVAEVVVGKEVIQHTEQINDTVCRTDVETEQLGTTGAK